MGELVDGGTGGWGNWWMGELVDGGTSGYGNSKHRKWQLQAQEMATSHSQQSTRNFNLKKGGGGGGNRRKKEEKRRKI